jgi:hypothetical protein
MVARHSAVVIESDPFGLLIQSLADQDVEVTDLPIVEFVALGWVIEGLFIVEYLLLQVVEMIFVALGGHADACLSVGNGLE